MNIQSNIVEQSIGSVNVDQTDGVAPTIGAIASTTSTHEEQVAQAALNASPVVYDPDIVTFAARLRRPVEEIASKFTIDEIRQNVQNMVAAKAAREQVDQAEAELNRLKAEYNPQSRKLYRVTKDDLKEQQRIVDRLRSVARHLEDPVYDMLRHSLQRSKMSVEAYQQALARQAAERQRYDEEFMRSRTLVPSEPIINYAIDTDHWRFQK
jgi:hypothetical protein